MSLESEERLVESPYVEKIWFARSERAQTFTSLAGTQWEMVVTRYHGQTSLTIRGPETKATTAECPADAEFFGIVFNLGAFMPDFPTIDRTDRNDLTLPKAGSRSFWLKGAAWELPSFDNADVFINRLVRSGMLVKDEVVDGVLRHGQPPADLSIRTVRRRFLRSTGLTYGTIRQIERAKQALALLQQGCSILDTVYEAGYFDQPHLTRAMKLYTGHTPTRLDDLYSPELLSLLYKTQAAP
jgi:hypothetical protein